MDLKIVRIAIGSGSICKKNWINSGSEYGNAKIALAFGSRLKGLLCKDSCVVRGENLNNAYKNYTNWRGLTERGLLLKLSLKYFTKVF